MRTDGALVTSLKQQRFHGSLTAEAYASAIAPIQARHGWIFDFWSIHWLYYTQILFLLTATLMIVLSFVTRPSEASAMRFTWYGATAEEKAATRASWSGLDVALSVVVLIAVGVFYLSFW